MRVSPDFVDTATLGLRSDVVATVLEDGAVLLDLQTKYFYALNPSGWSIVQHFEAGSTTATVEAVARSCGAPDDGAVRAFVSALDAYGLLETTSAPTDSDAQAVPGTWAAPTIERQPEPLQRVLVSAFDPSIPLAE